MFIASGADGFVYQTQMTSDQTFKVNRKLGAIILTMNDNDNDNNFIVMKLHFHSLYKSDNIPNEDCFSLAKKTCIMYNAQEKMVIILHDNEGMKPWLMGPNLSFTISRCQNRVQGNKVTVQYFGAMLNCHNAKQGLMFVSNIYRKNYEISINAYTYMHIDIYICIHIYMHIYIHMCT